MQQDTDGVWILGQDDVFGQEQDPNLSGPPFQNTREGDGEYVELTGFGFGDPTRVKARALSIIRGVYAGYPVNTGDGEEADEAQRVRQRENASIVLGSGEKKDLGSVPEA